MNIRVPSMTPDGKEVKVIGQYVSGGADSAILCYLICKDIRDRNLDIKLMPMTVRRPRPANTMYAPPVVEKIAELLNIPYLDHQLFFPKLTGTKDNAKYVDGQYFSDKASELFKTDQMQLLYTGITRNPPKEVQLTFNDGINKEEHIRGVGAKRPLEQHHSLTWNKVKEEFNKDAAANKGTNSIKFQSSGNQNWLMKTKWGRTRIGLPETSFDFLPWEYWEKKPFLGMDKKDIARLYEEEGILDDLFPLTRSCENDDTLDYHCGYCWWCDERKWAFNGRLT